MSGSLSGNEIGFTSLPFGSPSATATFGEVGGGGDSCDAPPSPFATFNCSGGGGVWDPKCTPPSTCSPSIRDSVDGNGSHVQLQHDEGANTNINVQPQLSTFPERERFEGATWGDIDIHEMPRPCPFRDPRRRAPDHLGPLPWILAHHRVSMAYVVWLPWVASNWIV